ncbi:MAG: helix-turn-helix domain-containing protein [Egibacteraceae bacterium]
MAMGITIDGSVLRKLRQDRFWSQADLASHSCAFALSEGDRQCGISRETVSKLECGSRTPSPRTLRYLVGALRPGMACLRRLLDREPPQALVDLALQEGEETRRLDLLAAGLAVVATSPVDALERIAHALGRPTRVDEPLLSALLGHTGRLGGAAIGVPPRVLIQPAIAHLGTLERLHGHFMTPAHRQRLHAAAADAAALVGWLHWLMDHHADAQDAMTLAHRLARDTGDDTVQARVLSFMSWMSSTIPSAGQRGTTAAALALAAQAAALGHRAPPGDRAWLTERCATEHAAAGQADACWRGMDVAWRILDEERSVEERAAGFFATFLGARDTRHVAGAVGLCHVLLGQPRQAEIVLTRQLNEVDPSDVPYVTALLSDLTIAYTLQDEPKPAARSAIEAVGLARIGGLSLHVERIRGVRALMPDSWTELTCIKNLDERLA